MRNEMIGAVVRRALEDPDFRALLLENPDPALEAHGFALEPDDRRELERIRAGLSGEVDDVEQKLVALAEEYGIDPEPDRG